MKPREHFPSTRRTWLEDRMQEGEAGRARINRFLMEVYHEPLKAYFKGCRNALPLGDADDVVAGFFADRLARDAFLEQWLGSGIQLRRWLMNGFGFFLKERARSVIRDRKQALTFELELHDAAEDNLEREYARSLVRSALDAAREVCEQKRLLPHWEVFWKHHHQGVDYGTLSKELDLSPQRASVMARTARNAFKDALGDLLVRDGCPRTGVDDEIGRLLDRVMR